MIDRFTSMSVFVKVCELGNFSAAATVLGFSSQMVGKHVKALEARLGAQLIRRSTRRQSLTEVGQMYYDRCLIVLADLKDADSVTEKMNAAPQGHLRISAPVGFGSCLLAPALMQFIDIYNKIEIELVITDRFVDLLHEGFDAVLRLGPFADSSLAVRYISQHRQVLCASPAYLKRFGTPEKPGDLKAHDCLSYLNASGLPYAQWLFSKDGQEEVIRVQSRFRINDGRVLAEAAVTGRGIILQPEAVLRKHLDSGELVPLLDDYAAPTRDMALIFSAARPQTPKMRALIDFIIERFPITLQA